MKTFMLSFGLSAASVGFLCATIGWNAGSDAGGAAMPASPVTAVAPRDTSATNSSGLPVGLTLYRELEVQRDFAAGDWIQVTDMGADRPPFQKGGRYRIKGRCALLSVEEGTLEILSVPYEPEPGQRATPKSFGRIDASKTSDSVLQAHDFAFDLTPAEPIFGFELVFRSAAGGTRLGGIRATKSGC